MYLCEQQQIHKVAPSLSPAVQPQQDPPTLNLAVQEKG